MTRESPMLLHESRQLQLARLARHGIRRGQSLHGLSLALPVLACQYLCFACSAAVAPRAFLTASIVSA